MTTLSKICTSLYVLLLVVLGILALPLLGAHQPTIPAEVLGTWQADLQQMKANIDGPAYGLTVQSESLLTSSEACAKDSTCAYNNIALPVWTGAGKLRAYAAGNSGTTKAQAIAE